MVRDRSRYYAVVVNPFVSIAGDREGWSWESFQGFENLSIPGPRKDPTIVVIFHGVNWLPLAHGMPVYLRRARGSIFEDRTFPLRTALTFYSECPGQKSLDAEDWR